MNLVFRHDTTPIIACFLTCQEPIAKRQLVIACFYHLLIIFIIFLYFITTLVPLASWSKFSNRTTLSLRLAGAVVQDSM